MAEEPTVPTPLVAIDLESLSEDQRKRWSLRFEVSARLDASLWDEVLRGVLA